MPSITALAVVGCSGGNGNPGTGGSGAGSGGAGGAASGELVYKPCDPAQRTGLFALELKSAAGDVGAFTQFGGALRDKVSPGTVLVSKRKEGDCSIMVAPNLSCAPACTNLSICLGQNQCAPPPVNQGIGEIQITGLATALTASPLGNNAYSTSLPVATQFPPAAPGATIGFSAAGAGAIAALSLQGRGISPLEVPTTPPMILKTPQPLTITWTPPAMAGKSRIYLSMDIAHHGGGSAQLECDWPDTGSGVLSAAMLTALLAEGSAGFSTYSLVRRTADSATVGAGCVEFDVASTADREVTIEGIISCNDQDLPCPEGRVCRPAGVPGGLACE
ncbi:MAG: hypothetical protein ABIW57_03800 [Polyangia bacterium]